MKNKILKMYGIEKLENAFNIFETQLKDDEFKAPHLYGEFGRNVSPLSRRTSQVDVKAPVSRIHAFYTYCAFEYFYIYSRNQYSNEINRILHFAEEKLSAGGYHTTRISDGYIVGTHDFCERHELNYRHTFALAQIIALANQNKYILRTIKHIILAPDVQNESGGWPIWESDRGSMSRSDPVTSGYALHLLQYYLEHAGIKREKELIEKNIYNTILT